MTTVNMLEAKSNLSKLIAQARTEPLRLLAVDRAMSAYGDFVELV